MFLNTFNSEVSYIEVQFPDQNSKSLEIEAKTNLIINNISIIKMRYLIEPRDKGSC